MKKTIRLFCLFTALVLLLTACTKTDLGITTEGTTHPSPVSPDVPGTSTLTPMPTPSSPTPGSSVSVSPISPTPSPSLTPTPTPTPTPPPTPTPTPTPTPPVVPGKYEVFYPAEKVIAFTFDDGPDWVTPKILDVIEGTEDKVSFFITGYMIDVAPTTYGGYVKRAHDMGCDIGSHTYDHKHIYKSNQVISDEVINDQLGRLAEKYTALTGDTLHLLRPPGGGFDKKRNYGYATILWSVDSLDWKYWGDRKKDLYPTDRTDEAKIKATDEVADQVAKEVLSKVKPGDIVLMHDLYETTAIAFERIYTELKAQGYRFVTVSELLNIQPEYYAGWYFYDTGRAGINGSLDMAKRPAAQSVMALPPEKIF